MDTKLPYSEKELVQRLAKGDEMAFRMIYDMYRKKIGSFAFLLTESEDMADEILQEVFVKLWVNRTKLLDVEHFNAWLHAVTRNLVMDTLKRMARERKILSVWSASTSLQDNSADEIIFARENQQLLYNATKLLTPQQQKVYRLSHEQGLKHDEIASQLGISRHTVKNHLATAMQTIREYFRLHADLILLVIFLHQHL